MKYLGLESRKAEISNKEQRIANNEMKRRLIFFLHALNKEAGVVIIF
jgi:hypothetical protein